jgi:prepilin-type N-terminal cleavage/methylation domain-containing protein
VSARRARQAGLTLIELMIAIVLASLLIGLVLDVYVRMTTAYRAQMAVSEAQQTLRSARDVIAVDLRMAGHRITRLRTATGAFGTTISDDLPAVSIDNGGGANGTDIVRAYYADSSSFANVVSIAPDNESIVVDDAGLFRVDDIVVLTSPILIEPPSPARKYVEHDACALKITGITGTTDVQLDVAGGAPYNVANNGQCGVVAAAVPGGGVQMMLMRGLAYRIDPTRPELAILQKSETGELEDDWADLASGVVNLQIASRWVEPTDTIDDLDLDGDPGHDWYSGEAQETPDLTGTRPVDAIVQQLSVGITTRSNELSVVGSSATPEFYDATNPDNNQFGDSESVAVAPTHIYRGSRELVDLRNMGVGR